MPYYQQHPRRSLALTMKIEELMLSALGVLLANAPSVHAQAPTQNAPPPAPPRNLIVPDQGKLLLTAGFNDAEGAGGGGLVPFALISGYGTDRSWGANAHYTIAPLADFKLTAYGIAVGVADRIEASITRQDFEATGTALDGISVGQDVFGLKVRLVGDAVYDQDSWMPQVSVGAQVKRHRGIDDAASAGLPNLVSVEQLAADDEDGTDYYLAATKVLLDKSLLLNAVVRYTKANQFGLLGFGGDEDDDYSPQLEASIGWLLTRKLAVGAEYRSKPDNLSADKEDAAWTVFAAWAPTRNVSVVAAYLNIGSVLAPVTTQTRDQDGPYVSLQVGF
jgi:hypothetical protein